MIATCVFLTNDLWIAVFNAIALNKAVTTQLTNGDAWCKVECRNFDWLVAHDRPCIFTNQHTRLVVVRSE